MSNPVTCRNQILPIAARSIAAAAALCCAGVASAQSSVTLYGIVDAAVVYTTNQNAAGNSKTAMDAGQLATSRWGFKGTEDLGGGLKANFALESTLTNDTGAGGNSFGNGASTTATFFDRISTVGLSGGFGSVNVGRQNMLGVDAVGLADPIGFAHAANNPNVAWSALNISSITQSSTGNGFFGTNNGSTELRQNNSIKYSTPNFSGFGGAAMYGFGEQAGNNSANTYKGVSGYFTDGQSGAALAYAQLTDNTNSANLTLFGGGAKYVMNAFTFKATYVQNEVNTTKRKVAVIGLGIDYALSAATTLTGAYYNTKVSGLADATVPTAVFAANGKADQFIVLGKYALSKRTVAYASLTHATAGSTNNADQGLNYNLIGAGQSSANRAAMGVMHSF